MRRTLIALACCAMPGIAGAATVNVTATGTLFLADDPSGLLPFGDLIVDSTKVTITFAYDPAAVDQDSAPDRGRYFGAADFTIDINGVQPAIAASPLPGPGISIGNDQEQTTPVGWHVDRWNVSSNYSNYPGNYLQMQLTRNKDAPTTPPLVSDALVLPEWPDGWEFGLIIFRIQQGSDGSATTVAELYANVDSLSTTVVPISAASWLFASALGLLGWLRTKAT